MWSKIYGGSSFPFVTTVHVPVVRWIACAMLLTPVVLVLGVLAGLAALIWRFV